jgi:hypothetical protein
MGSPTYLAPVSTWSAWSRPSFTYQYLTYISSGAPLFTHQYSHAWFDFQNKKDAFADYFHNSILATSAHRLFCISLESEFFDYGADLWGISSSDSKSGYVACGGPPALGPIDGTVVPCATAGSLPFLYSQAIHVLSLDWRPFSASLATLWIRGCVQSTDRMVRPGCCWHRCRNRDADGGKLSDRIRKGYLYEKSRSPGGHAIGGIPSNLACPYFSCKEHHPLTGCRRLPRC